MTDQQHEPFAPQPTQPTQPPAYGAPSGYAGPPAYGFGSPWGPLAGWGTRVLAMLLDSLLSLVGMIPYIVGFVLIVAGSSDTSSSEATAGLSADEANAGMIITGVVLVVIGVLAMLGIQIWNRAFKQGRTGQSVGKKAMGITLVDERTGQPIGAAMSFVRELAHALDGFFYLGYLWPLWDDKRQTFADKILGTVVVETPKN
jgi:uncharacterized RDD family membrane protein YckC